VAFVGEQQKFRGHFLLLEHGEQLQPLAGDVAEILFAVNHQRGRLELTRIKWRVKTFRTTPGYPRRLPSSPTARTIVHRAAPGHREQLGAALRQRPAPGNKLARTLVLTLLEGANWNFVEIDRYNSLRDLVANEANDRASMLKGEAAGSRSATTPTAIPDTAADRITP
jgi:hypothetical protein